MSDKAVCLFIKYLRPMQEFHCLLQVLNIITTINNCWFKAEDVNSEQKKDTNQIPLLFKHSLKIGGKH